MIGDLDVPPRTGSPSRRRCSLTRRDRRFGSRRGRHGPGSTSTSTRPVADARIALSAGARRRAHREPDLIASRGAVDALEHELEVEAELQLADHDERRFVRAQGDQVAAADLAFDVESEAFEKALHRDVERRLPHAGYWLWGGLMQHEWIPA